MEKLRIIKNLTLDSRCRILRLSPNVQAFQSKKSKPYNIECKVKLPRRPSLLKRQFFLKRNVDLVMSCRFIRIMI